MRKHRIPTKSGSTVSSYIEEKIFHVAPIVELWGVQDQFLVIMSLKYFTTIVQWAK